jgi:hypothetical protein
MTPHEPPNLRECECCKWCKHYMFHCAYECTKYDVGVDAFSICDDYEREDDRD